MRPSPTAVCCLVSLAGRFSCCLQLSSRNALPAGAGAAAWAMAVERGDRGPLVDQCATVAGLTRWLSRIRLLSSTQQVLQIHGQSLRMA